MAINPYVTDVNILLGLLSAFLGFPAGILVAYLSKEELDDGRKYLYLMIHFVFALAAAALMFALKMQIWFIVPISIAVFALSIAIQLFVKNRLLQTMLWYIGTAIMFSLITSNIFAVVVMLALIFMIGLPLGSLFAEEYLFKRKRAPAIKKKGKREKKNNNRGR